MGWIAEGKIQMQNYYSGYCQMSKALGNEPVPYHSFTTEIYDQTRKDWKIKKTELKKEIGLKEGQ